MKIWKCFIAILILISMLAAGCGNVATGKINQDKKPDKIRLSYGSTLSSCLFIVAKQKGWFEEEFKKDGITVEYDKFINGPPVMEALAGGRLDFGSAGDQPALQGKANNIDIKVIGISSIETFNPGTEYAGIIVPEGSDIHSIKDLKGKKVGVSVGTFFHKHLLHLLKDHGLSTNDIKLVNMDSPNMKVSIETKTIDAALLPEPFLSSLELEKKGHRIKTDTDIKPFYNVIMVRNEFAQQYPDIVKRVLKVYAKTIQWVAENPQETNEILSKETGVSLELVQKATIPNKYDLRITDDVIQSIEETQTFLKGNGILKRDVDLKDLIDISYLKAIGVQ